MIWPCLEDGANDRAIIQLSKATALPGRLCTGPGTGTQRGKKETTFLLGLQTQVKRKKDERKICSVVSVSFVTNP